VLAPSIVTVLLVLWTVTVSPKTVYGDKWAVWPAFLALPIVFLWHIAIVISLRGHRRLAGISAALHLAVFVPLWFICLMLISKDSL